MDKFFQPKNQDAITTARLKSQEVSLQIAKSLVKNLNYGALPVPITLSNSQTIGASLGQSALASGTSRRNRIALVIFLILWYSCQAWWLLWLVSYIILSLGFQMIPVTHSRGSRWIYSVY